MCSCPPFECFCRPLPYPTHPMDVMMSQPPTHLPPAHLASLPPPPPAIHDPHRLSPLDITHHQLDIGVQLGSTMSRDYNEYFELNPERYGLPLSVPQKAHQVLHNSHCSMSPPQQFQHHPHHPQSLKQSLSSLGSKSDVDPYSSTKLSSPQSDCMFSDSGIVDTSTVSLFSASPSHIKAEPELSPSSLVTSTTIPSILSPTAQGLSGITPSLSPAGERLDVIQENPFLTTPTRPLEDFDITTPADILSLDKPINRGPQSERSRKLSSCSNGETRSCSEMRTSMDLASFFSLPSITSFLDEDAENKVQGSEHVEKILGLSLNYDSPNTSKDSSSHLSPVSNSDQKVPNTSCSPPIESRGNSPHSLVELQPLCSAKPTTASYDPKQSDGRPYKQGETTPPSFNGAFQPYTSTYTKDSFMTSTPNYTNQKYTPLSTPDYPYYHHHHADMYSYPPMQTQQQQLTRNNHHINITLSL